MIPTIPAVTLAKLCAEIYPPEVVPTVQRDDVRLYVRDLPGVRVLLFGATHPDNIEDLIRDLEARPIDLPDVGTVHEGFGRGAQYIIPDVIPAAISQPFILAGHSLGGALALVVGAMLAVRGIIAAQITTFGAPRPGYGRLGEILAPVPLLDENQAYGDPIPGVPPPFPFPYRHPVQTWRQGGAPTMLGQHDAAAFPGIAHHAITNYIGLLPVLA